MKNLSISKLLVPAIMSVFILSGCSARSESAGQLYFSDAVNGGNNSKSDSYDYGVVATTAATAAYETNADYEYVEEEAETPAAKADSSDGEVKSLEKDGIQKEMLVYSCNMVVDTLDFDTSLNSFKNTLEMYGGFVETENFSDGGSGGRWYYENEEKWKGYSATVRIPSKNYDAFCNSAGDLGDLRSKTSNVENLSQEYSDLSTTLEIYEAKEQRYIALLADITEDEYAVQIERELTDIQIKIANIKTRMNRISTDVAYSYVYFTLNEVKEYVSEPIKTDTFLDRLGNTLSDAGSGFLDFLEGLLFFLIYTGPYLILIGIAAFVTVKIVRKSKAKKLAKIQAQREQYAKQAAENASNGTSPHTEQKLSDTEKTEASEDGSEDSKSG